MKLKFFCVALLASLCMHAFGQVPAPGAPTQIYTFVEQQPQFPGGEQAMNQFLMDNLKYPESAQQEGKEGLVVLSFVINEDGSRSEYQVLKSQGDALNNEAIRVITAMPNWTAGKQNGKTVRVRFTMPIRFSLKTEQAQVPGPTITRERFSGNNAVDKMPGFPGGPGPMLVFIERNIKYPKAARKSKIQGEVLLNFIVLENGQLADIRIIKPLEASLDTEALRVVQNMPTWQPGMQAGKPVKVRYTLPVRFLL